MKKILIGGCSFSQYQGFPSENNKPKWISWTDFLEKDLENTHEIINSAQSSFGQSMIVQSVTEELINNNFEIDYVIIQWSAIGRSYSTSESDFVNRVIEWGELQFAPHIKDYVIDVGVENWVTNSINTISSSFYQTSLIQMYLMKSLLTHKNIPYKMFWGWQQINLGVEESCNDLLNLIYDEHFWKFNEHGGMSEFIITNLGEDVGLVGGGDFHPSTVGQEYFYNNVVKTWNF